MGHTDIEFELVRSVHAPVEQVFARLVDINRYQDWMPTKGSILKRTVQTSDGEPRLGTTYVDETTVGDTPGDIAEFDPPHEVVFHWWDRKDSGRTKMEGWPGYSLRGEADGTTTVRHHARLRAHGVYRLAAPVLRRLAVKERTATIDALKASFEER